MNRERERERESKETVPLAHPHDNNDDDDDDDDDALHIVQINWQMFSVYSKRVLKIKDIQVYKLNNVLDLVHL